MTIGAAEAWLALALALGVAELLAPGVFLVFVAAAAAMTGLELFAAPALPFGVQLLSVALWSAVTVVIGRRWHREYPVGGDERLNRPERRLIGRAVVAEVDFVGGTGRVRVGDGGWPARSERPVAAGEQLRVVAIEGGVLVVEDPA